MNAEVRMNSNNGMTMKTNRTMMTGLALLVAAGCAATAVWAKEPQTRARTAQAPTPAATVSGEKSELRVEKHRGENPPKINAEDVEGTSSNLVMSTDGATIRARQIDDEIRVSVGGKKLATEKITDDSWSELRILDKDDEIVATIVKNENGTVSACTGEWSEEKQEQLLHRNQRLVERAAERAQVEAERGARWRGLANAYGGRAGGGQGGAVAAFSVPRVMMGVTMDKPGEGMAKQLGVDADEVTLISGVTEDLPAAKAGLQKFDIVVKVDDKTPADEQTIRSVLRKKNPGDTIAFDVIRSGEHKTVSIKLEEYDAEKLGSRVYGSGTWSSSPGAEAQAFRFFGDEEREALEKKNQELAKLAQKLSELSAQLGQQKAEGAQKAARDMAELGERMSELAAELAERSAARTWTFEAAPMPAMPAMPPMPQMSPSQRSLLEGLGVFRGQPGMRIERGAPGAPPNVLVIPSDPADQSIPGQVGEDADTDSSELNDHVKNLDDRMGKIDARLERLEELLKRIDEAKGRGGR
ncbi:MAG TPA: PDZ domain-containing protein [Phycisphaerales bacterium]|nr:PDZ domain-containing protein [Phycisphaerales bacterium]